MAWRSLEHIAELISHLGCAYKWNYSKHLRQNHICVRLCAWAYVRVQKKRSHWSPTIIFCAFSMCGISGTTEEKFPSFSTSLARSTRSIPRPKDLGSAAGMAGVSWHRGRRGRKLSNILILCVSSSTKEMNLRFLLRGHMTWWDALPFTGTQHPAILEPSQAFIHCLTSPNLL